MTYESWDLVFDLNSTPSSISSTSVIFSNSDGTQTRVFGTGLSFANGEFIAGTVSGIDRFDSATGSVLISYSNASVNVSAMSAFLQNALTSGQQFVDLSSLLTGDFESSFTFGPSVIEASGDNGNVLQIIGTNLSVNGLPNPTGIVTEMRVLGPGGNVIQTTGPVNYTIEQIEAGTEGGDASILGAYIFNRSAEVFVDDTYQVLDYIRFYADNMGSRHYTIELQNFVTLDYYNSAVPLIANFQAGTLTRGIYTDTFTFAPTAIIYLEGSQNNDVVTLSANVRSFWAGGGNDSVTGSNQSDHIEGFDGNDLIEGGFGGDYLQGGGSPNGIYADNGNDTLSYASSNAGVVVNLASNTAAGGDAGGDIINGFENLIGSAYHDTLTGSAVANSLSGGAGNDVLNGGAGSDSLSGGSGFDTADYTTSTAGVQVNLFYSSGLYGEAQGDTYSSIENVWGSEHNDIMRGTTAANILEGRGGNDQLMGDGGNDILRGGGGNDLLVGGVGADVLEGGSGFDTIDYSASNARVLINLFYGNALEGHAAGDTYSSIENVWGSAFNDIIRGSTGANILRGGAGADTLTGDGGADYFQYNTAAFGNDLITDFADNSDKLDFRGSGLLAVNMVVQVSAGDTYVSFSTNPGHVIKLDNFVGTFNASDCLF